MNYELIICIIFFSCGVNKYPKNWVKIFFEPKVLTQMPRKYYRSHPEYDHILVGKSRFFLQTEYSGYWLDHKRRVFTLRLPGDNGFAEMLYIRGFERKSGTRYYVDKKLYGKLQTRGYFGKFVLYKDIEWDYGLKKKKSSENV